MYIGENNVIGAALGSQIGHKLYLGEALIWEDPVIEFEEGAALVETICVNKWGGGVYPNKITRWEAANVTNVTPSASNAYFQGCQMITFNEFKYFTGIESISAGNSPNYGLFRSCSKLVEVTLPQNPPLVRKSGTQIIQIQTMFRGCSNLKRVDFSPWATSGTVRIYQAFYQSGFEEVDLSPFKRIGAWEMCFYGARKLKKLITTGCTFTQGATGSYNPFTGCSALTSIEGGFNGCRWTLDFRYSPLDVESAIGILESLSERPTSGATITFRTSQQAIYEANEDFLAAVDAVNENNWQIGFATA